MKKHYFILILFSVAILISSCTSNSGEIKINNFKGCYKIKTISSSLEIDLNNDGLKSNNYLEEIKANYISYSGEVINYGYDNDLRSNSAQARPTKYDSNNTQFLDILFPIQRIDSVYQGNDHFVKMNIEYQKMITGFIYKLTNNNVEIESDPFNQFEYYDIANFQINKINNFEFEINFDYKVYDFKENKWVETKLKAKYEKMEE
jgi:hypothetical protein